jgi:hypothetical protein
LVDPLLATPELGFFPKPDESLPSLLVGRWHENLPPFRSRPGRRQPAMTGTSCCDSEAEITAGGIATSTTCRRRAAGDRSGRSPPVRRRLCAKTSRIIVAAPG